MGGGGGRVSVNLSCGWWVAGVGEVGGGEGEFVVWVAGCRG